MDLILYIVIPPIALLATVGVLGWRFRQSVGSTITNGANGPNPAEQGQASSALVPLVLCRLETAEVGLVPGQAATALSGAEATARLARIAYIAAGLTYIAVTIFAFTLGMAAISRKWPYAQFLLVYLQQWPALFILVRFLGISFPARLVILSGYLLLGLLSVPFAPSFSYAAKAAPGALEIALAPMAGLVLLMARPLRPWLTGVFAILLYLLTATAAGFLFGIDKLVLDKLDLSGAHGWWLVEGAILPVIAVVFVGWLLRTPRWRVPTAGLALMAVTGLLAEWLFPDYEVGPFHLGPSLLGLPLNVLQVFIVWLVFKWFVHLQEWQFLPAQVLHSHLCWGFLTIYVFILTAFANSFYQWWTPWAVLLAFALYLTVLHVQLRRIWVAHVSRPGKRLLLLRVFGRADKREKLLDALDDTWRRLGRIDLIAGTDLATRTMGSLMLEAFLLRRTDDQFLKTDKEVSRRLEHLHAHVEGDARYPVNGIYCYPTAWRHAVAHLAPKSDAVLMDLRGFTRKNQGCVFELTWVVQQIPLSRIILLIDATSDYQALEEIAQAAWRNLPSDSPNADYLRPVLTILNTPLRSRDSRRALFMLLLGAAFHDEA